MIAGCSKTLVEQTELDLDGHSSFGNLIKIRFGWVMFQPRFCKKSYRLVHIQSSVNMTTLRPSFLRYVSCTGTKNCIGFNSMSCAFFALVTFSF